MLTRRRFVGSLAAAAAAGIAWPGYLQADADAPREDAHGALLPTRALGRSGEQITMLGLGGQHLRKLPEELYQPCIEASIEGGIRFFDTAASYGREQLSEKLYGRLLTPRYRDEVFIMTKSLKRTAQEVQRELDQSLRNMNIDAVDLWQVHTLESVEDVEARFENGIIDVFLRAREQGKARYIGFTGHKDYRAHRRFLELLAEREVEFDAVQMPINIVDPGYDSFIEHILPVAVQRGYGVLAMKTMCNAKLFGRRGEFGPRRDAPVPTLIPDKVSFADATRYIWSLPITSRIAGVDNIEQLRENIAVARAARPFDESQRAAILAAAAEGFGPDMEFYKRNTRPGADENY